MSGSFGQCSLRRSSCRQSCSRRENMRHIRRTAIITVAQAQPQPSLVTWGCRPVAYMRACVCVQVHTRTCAASLSACLLFVFCFCPENQNFLCEVSQFLGVDILFNSFKHSLFIRCTDWTWAVCALCCTNPLTFLGLWQEGGGWEVFVNLPSIFHSVCRMEV